MCYLIRTAGWRINSIWIICRWLPSANIWRGGNDVTIHLQKDLGNSIHYDGVIQEETITDILGVLSRLSDISYNVKGKNISITSK